MSAAGAKAAAMMDQIGVEQRKSLASDVVLLAFITLLENAEVRNGVADTLFEYSQVVSVSHTWRMSMALLELTVRVLRVA